jgi:hypothetical protein
MVIEVPDFSFDKAIPQFAVAIVTQIDRDDAGDDFVKEKPHFFLEGNGPRFPGLSAPFLFSGFLARLIARSRFFLSSGVITLSSSGLRGTQSSCFPLSIARISLKFGD